MSATQIACPECNSLVEDDGSMPGLVVACPICGKHFQMPGTPKPRRIGRPVPVQSQSSAAVPGVVNAIRIMLLCGAGWNILVAAAGCIGSGGLVLLWPSLYVAIAAGAFGIIQGLAALDKKPTQLVPILLIFCVLNCDPVSLALGIVMLVLMKDAAFVDYYARPT